MSGPSISPHGDVISSNLSTSTTYRDAAHMRYQSFNLMPGQIVQIYTVDDSNNTPGFTGINTLYDVLAYHPDGSSEIIRRCMMLQPGFGGGFNNFMEVVSQNPGPKAKDGSVGKNLKPGSFVLLAFINGHRQSAIILGAMPHSNKVAVQKRPKKSDGTTYKWEFQGFQFQVFNDGHLEMTFNGPRDDQGKFIGKDGPTTLKFDPKGNFSVTNNNKQSVTVDRVKKVIDVVNGDTEIKMEQDSKKITVNCDLLVANVKKDATVTTEGKTIVNATKDVVVSSDSAIKLQKGKDGSPSEPYVMGQKFKSFMGDLLDAIAAIKALGNLGAPAPLMPDVIAKFTAMKPKIDELLSELIKGM